MIYNIYWQGNQGEFSLTFLFLNQELVQFANYMDSVLSTPVHVKKNKGTPKGNKTFLILFRLCFLLTMDFFAGFQTSLHTIQRKR